MTRPSDQKPVALITGASAGIGEAVALTHAALTAQRARP